jgi:hypothetical protein
MHPCLRNAHSAHDCQTIGRAYGTYWATGISLMEQIVRKIIAIAAAPGFIAGVCIFIASFFGLTMNKLGAKAFLLHLGIFALGIPLRRPLWGEATLGRPEYTSTWPSQYCALFRSPRSNSCNIPRNHQWRVRPKRSWENSWVHLRKRISLPERLGIAPLRVGVDVCLLLVDDALVVSSARTLDRGDA